MNVFGEVCGVQTVFVTLLMSFAAMYQVLLWYTKPFRGVQSLAVVYKISKLSAN
jgi:hypothetical protein